MEEMTNITETEIEAFKDKFAVSKGFEHWENLMKTLFFNRDPKKINNYENEVIAKFAAQKIDPLQKIVEKINNTPEDTGREGCTYGDTKFDSLSAVHGYNLCLQHIKEIANEMPAGIISDQMTGYEVRSDSPNY